MHATEADHQTGAAQKTVNVDAKSGKGLGLNSKEFDQILDTHAGMLSRIASQYEVRPAQREDLLQEIAFAIWQALPTWRGDASIKTFIARIAHNHGVNHVIADRCHGAHEDLPEDLLDGAPQPDQQAYRYQQARQLLKAIRRLPLGLGQATTLALEGFSHAEIGDILGISVNNVDVRLFRARSALKEALEQ
jgi:RNA polymerase sigma-70 factor (ECF subfamily)